MIKLCSAGVNYYLKVEREHFSIAECIFGFSIHLFHPGNRSLCPGLLALFYFCIAGG